MVKPYDLLHIAFYEKSPFTGSVSGFRYRIEKSVVADEEGNETKRLKVFIYPEPFEFTKTPDEKKQFRYFPFSEDGLKDIAGWLSGISYENGEFSGV